MTFSRPGHDARIKLTSEDLYEISQKISREFAPKRSSVTPDSVVLPGALPSQPSGWTCPESQTKPVAYTSKYSDTRLSPLELLEISREINQKFTPVMSTDMPELLLLPVDPHHLYAFWNPGENTKISRPKGEPANPLILRVYWRPDESQDISHTKLWFDVALENGQSRKKVRLPIDDTAYSAVIGRLKPDNSLAVFADSNTIHVPCDKMKPPAMQRKMQIADTGTGPARYEKDLNKQLSGQQDGYNEIFFFSKLQNMLHGNDTAEIPLPETNSSEIGYCQNNNASGQEN